MPLDFSAQAEAVGSGGNYNVKAPKADARMAKTISDISEGVQPLPTTWSGPSSKPLPSKTALPLSKEDIQREEAKGKLDFSSQAEGSAAMQGLEAIEPSVKREQPPEESFGKKALGVAEGVMGTGINLTASMLEGIEGAAKLPFGLAAKAMGYKGDPLAKPPSVPKYEAHTESGKETMDTLGKVLDPLTAIMPDLQTMHGATSFHSTPKDIVRATKEAAAAKRGVPVEPPSAFEQFEQSVENKPKESGAQPKGQLELPFSDSVETAAAERAKKSPQRDMFADTEHEEATTPKATESEHKPGEKKELPDKPGLPIIGEKPTDLETATNKIQAGRSFDMTAEEKVAWHKAAGLDNVAKNSDHGWEGFQEKIAGSKTVGEALQKISSDKDALLHHRVLAKALGITNAAKAKLNFWVPEDVAGAKYHGQRGTYYPENHSVSVFEGAGTSSFLHEAYHAAAVNHFMALGEKHPSVIALHRLAGIAAAEARSMGKDFYGTKFVGTAKGVHEFLAEAHTNPEFQKFLSSINDTRAPTGGAPSLWSTLRDLTKKVLNIKGVPDNVLDSVMKHSEEMLKSKAENKKPTAMELNSKGPSPEVAKLLKDHTDPKDFEEALVARFGEAARPHAAAMIAEHNNQLGWQAITLPKQVGEELRASNAKVQILTQDMIDLYKDTQKAGYDGKTASRLQDNIDHPEKMSAKDRSFYEKTVKPIQDMAKKSYAKLMEMSPEHPGLQDYIGRIAQKGFWGRFFGGLADSSAGGGFTYGNKPGALKGRSVFQITDPKTGKSTIVTQTKDGSVLGWNDKNSSLFSMHEKELKPGMNVNGFTIEQVKNQRDIEAHTNLSYVDDPLFVGMVKATELAKHVAELEALEKIKSSPVWQEMTSKVEDNNPNHIFLRYADRIPSLRNTKFQPELAWEIDDYLRPGSTNGAVKIIQGFNNLAIKAFMLIPFKHINNEFIHAIVGEGLTGMIPDATKRAAIAKGTASVINRDEFFKEVQATPGAALLSPRTQIDGWTAKTLDHLMTSAKNDPTVLSKLKEAGLSPVKFFNAWSRMSGNFMWIMRDSMYMSLVAEHSARAIDKGTARSKAIYDAVQHTNQYMPTYHLPTKILGSRFLSEQVMQNPMLTTFSPYHHGALSAIGTTAKKTTMGKDMAERGEGINHIAAYTFIAAAVYPIMDQAYKAWTKDEEARVRRAGGIHYLQAGADAFSENPERGPEQVFGSVLTPAPVPYALVQASPGINTNIFMKKPIRYPGDSIAGQAQDTASFMQGQAFNPAGITPVATGKQSFEQWFLSQMIDAEFPSEEKQARKERFEKKALKKHVKQREKE